MIKPVRLQLSRRKGFDLQAWSREVNGLAAVKVDRSTKWGNPNDWREWIDNMPRDVFWTIPEGKSWCCERAVEAFCEDVSDRRIRRKWSELRGKNLACWCAPEAPCHADVMLELANSP